MTPRCSMVLLLAALVLCAVVAAQSVATAKDGKDLLRASAPGAYSVRYMPDRALVSSSAQQEVELRVHLPRVPLWAYLDGQPQAEGFAGWEAEAQLAVLKLAAGSHELQVGWEGTGEQPQQGQAIELLVDGAAAGQLTARFTLERMVAEGSADLGLGTAVIWLTPAGATREASPVVSVGASRVTGWQPVEGRLRGEQPVGLSKDSRIVLTVEGYNLLSSPVAVVELKRAMRPSEVERVAEVPQDGTLVEAEDFTAQGGGEATISVGEHIDQHGGKSIMNYGGDGHWLEWEFEVPVDGVYDFYARIACAEEMSFRKVLVDGKLPADGFAMVQFPGTGGWAHAPGEWWFVRVAGASEQLPPLSLSQGKHVLRMEGLLQYHLNVDYFVLRAR